MRNNNDKTNTAYRILNADNKFIILKRTNHE
jgi:hypothetical protein